MFVTTVLSETVVGVFVCFCLFCFVCLFFFCLFFSNVKELHYADICTCRDSDHPEHQILSRVMRKLVRGFD